MPGIRHEKSRAGTCLFVIAHLSAYLDGELSGGIRAIVESHLAACSCCRELTRSLRLTIDLCRDLGKTSPPPITYEQRQRLFDAWFESQGAPG